MLEGIKILAERIVAQPELYDCQPRVTEVKLGDPEIPVEQQMHQLIKIVYDNEHGTFTEEEINHIKEAERECRRKVFNAWLLGIVADQYVYLPETREQRKERIEIEQEERKWRVENEKQKRYMEMERQQQIAQVQQRARQDEMLRNGRGIANNLTGGLF